MQRTSALIVLVHRWPSYTRIPRHWRDTRLDCLTTLLRRSEMLVENDRWCKGKGTTAWRANAYQGNVWNSLCPVNMNNRLMLYLCVPQEREEKVHKRLVAHLPSWCDSPSAVCYIRNQCRIIHAHTKSTFFHLQDCMSLERSIIRLVINSHCCMFIPCISYYIYIK